MKVSEVIKNNSYYMITKNGKILGINSVDNKLLNSEIKKIQVIKGLHKDITCIRL